jgi:phosphohistidine phosphatase
MKKIVLVRHAKSDWGNETLKDIDRPLANRGYDDAYYMSSWFKENYGLPDLMVSSAATRALSTAFVFARTFGIPESKVQVIESIYESKVSNLLKLISQLDDKNLIVMLFGHNPGITNLANELNRDILFDNLPTCAVVEIEFPDLSWMEISQKKEGKLINYKFPKSFKQT